MRPQQYLSLLLLAMLASLAAGCEALGFGQPTATPIPFDRLSVQDVFGAFARAGLEVQNPVKSVEALGRGAPSEFKDRYLFEVPRIAPAGGQIIAFANAQQLQAWQAYIETLRNNSATRRDVIYVYVHANILLQLNANLTNAEAAAYRDALSGL